jgi:hypothetical protein
MTLILLSTNEFSIKNFVYKPKKFSHLVYNRISRVFRRLFITLYKLKIITNAKSIWKICKRTNRGTLYFTIIDFLITDGKLKINSDLLFSLRAVVLTQYH